MTRRLLMILNLSLSFVLAFGSGFARSETATIAVATNFAAPAEAIAARLEAETGHEITLVSGATGKLYAQIVAGAPFDAFLAADAATPARLEAEGFAADAPFTYAIGALVLWSADPTRIGADGVAALRADDVRALAIADPALAPYGKAAVETLAALGLEEALAGTIVTAPNIGQAFALVATGAAELGFVARSALVDAERSATGSRWDVPAALHAPIAQDAVLLRRGADNAAAIAFLAALRTPEGRATIDAHGYSSE